MLTGWVGAAGLSKKGSFGKDDGVGGGAGGGGVGTARGDRLKVTGRASSWLWSFPNSTVRATPGASRRR
jgi:hypothetical protein